MAPVEDKKHGEKGNRGTENLTNGPAVDTKVAVKKEEAKNDRYIANKSYKNRKEKLFFSLEETGEYANQDGKQARNNQITSQGDGQNEPLSLKAIGDEANKLWGEN